MNPHLQSTRRHFLAQNAMGKEGNGDMFEIPEENVDQEEQEHEDEERNDMKPQRDTLSKVHFFP